MDSTSAIELAKNPVHNERSKHTDLKFHFIREHMKEKEIELVHVKREDQVANIFTKPSASMKDGRELSFRPNKLNSST